MRRAPLFSPNQVGSALDDTALIQYTSGTTGVPKGAELTHGNIVANCELQRAYIGVGEDEVPLGVLPWFHITGMECQMNMMAYGGATLVALGRFDLETVLRAIQRYRCTLTTFIATINIAILNWPRTKEFDLSSLRACFSGGAPVPAEIARRWEQTTGYKLIEGYGLSETTAPTHVNPLHRPKYGTVGVPLPFVDVKIVNLEDPATELGIGAAGEIAVRGPMVMKGYWRRPDATAEAIRDGWFLTGDVGRVDDEGYFTIDERKKDMIKASGYSVFPAEVEALMYRHPAIAEVGVVGVPDPYRGEDVLAFVVPKPGAKGKVTEVEIVEWCRREMSAYKRRVRSGSSTRCRRPPRGRSSSARCGSQPRSRPPDARVERSHWNDPRRDLPDAGACRRTWREARVSTAQGNAGAGERAQQRWPPWFPGSRAVGRWRA